MPFTTDNLPRPLMGHYVGLALEALVYAGGSGSGRVTLPNTGRSYAVTAELAPP